MLIGLAKGIGKKALTVGIDCTIPVVGHCCPASYRQKNKKRAMKSYDFMALFIFDQPFLIDGRQKRLCGAGHFIYPLGEAGNLTGCIPLVNGSLTGGPGNYRSSFPQGILCNIRCPGNHCFIEFADDCFHFCPVYLVAQTACLSLTVSLFSGFMICHVGIPPVIIVSLRIDELYIFSTHQ
jgi:hypothetical protein